MAAARGDDRHVFRFFVDAVGEPGATVELAAADARHLQVLRLDGGASVEVVDADGVLWAARAGEGAVMLVEQRPTGATEPSIELVAGALVGGRFDELVDAAVQAGASLVVPFAASRRDLDRLAARRARLQRIARAAAKQSKRSVVPEVGMPIDTAALLASEAGIVVEPAAPELLDQVVRRHSSADAPVRLLVGPAEGLSGELVDALAERGWVRGRLGPTILRAELAAPVAVAIAAMHVPRS